MTLCVALLLADDQPGSGRSEGAGDVSRAGLRHGDAGETEGAGRHLPEHALHTAPLRPRCRSR